MKPMSSRARAGVLLRREALACAAILAGCKGEREPPHIPQDQLVNEHAYQVSDPVAPPCIVREGAALTIERHGWVFRIRSMDGDHRISLQGDGVLEVAGANTADVRVELRPDARPVLVLAPEHEDRCWDPGRQLSVDWAAITADKPFVLELDAPNDRRECFVREPVVRVQRVRGDAGEVVRIEPTSSRVRLMNAGTAFQGAIEVALGATPTPLRIEVQILPGASDAGVACSPTQQVVTIPPARIPALGTPAIELAVD